MQGRSKMNVRIASLIAVCATVMCACGAEKVGVVGLQVNHLAEPQHVGAQPSFGWRMETTRAGARQKRGADQSVFFSDASYDLSDFLSRAIGMQD